MKIVDWGFNPEWLKYANEYWPGGARVLRTVDETPQRLSFEAKAAEEFTKMDVPFSLIKTFISVQKPNAGEGWEAGFPHIHTPLNGTSLVHYLQAEKDSAPLHILDGEDGEIVDTIKPSVGKTVIIPNQVYHGVKCHHGKENRIQLVAIAIP